MSGLARLMMMLGTPPAVLIAEKTGGAGSMGFTMPLSGPGGSVRPGDFMVVEYYDAVTISGGAGVAFATSTFAGTKVSTRAVQAADITTPFTFNVAGPYLLTIIRGPTSIGPAVRSGSFSGTGLPVNITGFTPSPGAVAIMGFIIAQGPNVTTQAEGSFGWKGSPPGYEGPFDKTNSVLTAGWGWSNGVLIDVGGYFGSAFIAYGNSISTVTYRICELF